MYVNVFIPVNGIIILRTSDDLADGAAITR